MENRQYGSSEIVSWFRPRLSVLDLNEEGVLVWIAEVISNRGTNQEASAIVGSKLIEMYKVNTDKYDMIKGYRADDSYTQVVEAFLMNQINITDVERLFYKGSLGNQIFIKLPKAFAQLNWTGSYEVEQEENNREEDIRARREVNKFMQGRMRAILLEGYEVPGITAQYAANHLLKSDKEGDCYV